MQDSKVIDILMDEIVVKGNCPDIMIDGGFALDYISDIFFSTNTPSFVSGQCTIETQHPDGGHVPLYGEFEITINNGDIAVAFKNFDIERN